MRKLDWNTTKNILHIAWPLIIANSFWNIQLTVDRIFLGAYSTEALGAAMSVMGVFWVPMALLQQTASYVTAFVAQYQGAGEERKIGSYVWQSIYISVFGGLLFLILNLFTPWFFEMVGHSDSIQALEVDYFNSLAFSALPMAFIAAISGFYTGIGRTKTVIAINFVGLIFNLALDPLLIFGKWGFPAMGIKGAGYATALSGYAGIVFCIYLLSHKNQEKLFRMRSSWRLNTNYIKKFLKYGIPSGMQWALEGLAFAVFLIIIGRLPNGDVALSSSSIAVTIMMLSVLPSMGIAQSVLTLVGQKMGESDIKAAIKTTWHGVGISFIYISLVASSFWLIPEFYISWFSNPQNPQLWSEVAATVPKLLKIVAIFILFDCIYLNISFALKGAGDTAFVSYVALIVPWPLMVLPAILFMKSPEGLLLSWKFVIVYMVAISILLIMRFKQGKWKSMNLRQAD